MSSNSEPTTDVELNPGWNTVSEASCCLCGASIIYVRHFPEWMAKFHTVYVTGIEADAETHVSFRGRRESFTDVIRVAAGHSAWAYKTSLRAILMPYDFQDSTQYTLVSDDLETTVLGFPFHSACWRILRASGRVSNKDIHLFNLCRSFPKQCGMLNWGHDYGGKAKRDVPLIPGEEPCLILRPIGSGSDVDPDSDTEFIMMFEGESSELPNEETGSITTLPRNHQVTDSDVFTTLPTEILLTLADHCTLHDLFRLKQSSRAFTNLHLPNSFWRNRFRPGGEFETLEAMRQTSCDGNPVQSIFEPKAPPDDRTWVTSSRALKPPGGILNRGCRVIYERAMTLPMASSAIYASTIEAFGRCYISGIRIQDKDGTSFSLGFRHPDEKRLLTSQDEQLQISGFDLAHDQGGVRGIAVVYNHGAKSDWMGDYDGLPKRMLRCDSLGAGVVDCLKGGFDAIKLVTLSVNAALPIEDQTSAPQAVAMQTLWYPDVPQPGLKFLGLDSVLDNVHRSASARDQDLPVCFKLFGDSDAKHVDKLISITILHRVRPEEVLGMTEISFIDAVTTRSTHTQNVAELGYRGTDRPCESLQYDHEETMNIDGPGGERIESITTSRSEGKMVGITVKTNRDRVKEFCAEKSMSERIECTDSSPISAEGNTVVGFWATMETKLGFTDFGLVVC
ncbi:hypothetical protein FSARC_13661 [Fusarium sarcochroum]|uniref:F-box domain-containing protein n=1 Tax=Fusarium sarcochroum TaxID=1208366 RepID=A0A8H4WSX0_9HYPO|nr:hypothetical protein FSARC_13661 [Fusarium sarcochroum]